MSTTTRSRWAKPPFRNQLILLLSLLLAALTACAPSGVSSPQGDRAAAERAASAAARQQAGASGTPAAAADVLDGSDLGLAYRFIISSFVEPVDDRKLIDAGAAALRAALRDQGVLPLDTAPLDLMPLFEGDPDADWNAFSTAYDAVIQRHLAWARQTRPDYLVLRKMAESLNDDHTVFLTAEETRRQNETRYSGIGVRLARLDPQGPAVIIEVFPSSPAALAGVRAGDRVLAVGDQSVAQAPLGQIVDLIRGPEGSEVTLQLDRTAAGAPFTVRVFRRAIDTPTADGQVIAPGIGYIRIRSFNETVAERVGRLLLEQRQAGAQSWIIDLRGNPGGNLIAVARVGGYFMDQRPIGIAVDRNGQREALFAEQRPFRVQAPIVVLIDNGSGSGAELLAAAFKEYQLGVLVGEKTSGNVGIAGTRQLPDGSTIQVTVRRLLSASGAQLDRVGVQPDETVGLKVQDLENGRDPQRDRAVQLLQQRLAGA